MFRTFPSETTTKLHLWTRFLNLRNTCSKQVIPNLDDVIMVKIRDLGIGAITRLNEASNMFLWSIPMIWASNLAQKHLVWLGAPKTTSPKGIGILWYHPTGWHIFLKLKSRISMVENQNWSSKNTTEMLQQSRWNLGQWLDPPERPLHKSHQIWPFQQGLNIMQLNRFGGNNWR